MLRELILGKDVQYFLEVPVPPGQIHIDGSFMVLDEKLCLLHEASFELFPCRLYEAGKEVRHVMFLDFLAARDIEWIALTEQERQEGQLNMVVTRQERTAIAFANATRIEAELEKRGWHVDTFPADTLWLGNGGAHCMTCPLLVG
jgi:N-dimethylarginine dimethylaminohydrolase